MPNPTPTPEEVERIRIRAGGRTYTLYEARCDITSLLSTLSAVQREREEAVRNQYAVIWRVVETLQLGAGGCPDALIIGEVERLRERAWALEEQYEALGEQSRITLKVIVKDRDALTAKVARVSSVIRAYAGTATADQQVRALLNDLYDALAERPKQKGA